MKRYFVWICLFFSLSSLSSVVAQKTFDEGIIRYAIDIKGLDSKAGSADIGMVISLLKNSTVDVVLKQHLSKFDINLGGGMLAHIQFMGNSQDNTGTMLFDIPMMQEKSAVNITKDDVDKNKKDSPAASLNASKNEVKYTGKKQKIAGYKCKEAKMELPNGKGTMRMFLTQEITATNAFPTANKGVNMSKVKGFPLSMIIEAEGIEFIMKAKEVKKGSVEMSHFNIPEDYPKMSMEDFVKKMGGAAKGLQGIGM